MSITDNTLVAQVSELEKEPELGSGQSGTTNREYSSSVRVVHFLTWILSEILGLNGVLPFLGDSECLRM